MKKIKDKSIIICSIVRNAETGLKHNIPVIAKLCSEFKSYKVFVYENDSTDKTKELLSNWSHSNPLNIFVSLNNTDSSKTIPSSKVVAGNPFFSYKRIEKMASIRNNYMEYVENKGWTADYFMVVDLDVEQLYLENILTSFEAEKEWDAVTAFGYSLSPKLRRRYHDTYALTLWGDESNPQTELKIKRLADDLGKLKPGDDWIRIASGFGGVAIYKFEAIRGLRYKVLPNNDNRVEVKCEHYSIYKQMIEKGYNHFYINPSMALQYQKLTFSIVVNSIKRKLSL